MDMILMSAIDAALASQSTLLAADSIGLVVCYVWAMRDNAQELIELLRFTPWLMSFFVIAIGYLNQTVHMSIESRLD